MQVFGDDFLYGDSFRASDFGLVTGSVGDNSSSDDSIAIAPKTNDVFLGENLNANYVSQTYSDHLELEITLIKDPCTYYDDPYFSEHDLRAILRVTTGQRGWQWTRIMPDDDTVDTDLWYRARTTDVTYNRIAGKIAGVTLTLTTDGAAAYSEPKFVTISATSGTSFYIYNDSDDLNNYTLGTWTITASTAGTLTLTNVTDDSWECEYTNLIAAEVLTIDSKREIITSSSTAHDVLLNDTNLHFPRLLPGKNEYTVDQDCTIFLAYRTARKVGVLQ